MTEILIDPNKSNIAVQVTSQSLHALGFEITVFATDGTTITEQFTGDTKLFNPFSKKLTNPPSTYKGSFLSGTFTVISADGTDFPYSIVFSIKEDDIIIMPEITLSGTTTNGSETRVGMYHMN
jgi:hypothetical protein